MPFFCLFFSPRCFTISAAVLLTLVSFSATVECFAAFNSSSPIIRENTPYALPCFSYYDGRPVERDENACTRIQQNYTSPAYRDSFASGYMNNQGEACVSETDGTGQGQCLLNFDRPADESVFLNKTCWQGNIPAYYVEVRSVGDVQEAIKAAKAEGFKITIKNSGHDYMGRSSSRDTLSLWTRNLTAVNRDQSFIPEGCSASSNISAIDAMTVGAGVNNDEVYKFADEQNVTFIGGYAPTIGVSGGWAMMGGHSVLSPSYGLGIDRVVQYKLVTADGVYRIANECQNRDLFWALRGGGGGTFGVVIESTHKVEKQLQLAVSSIQFPSTQQNAQQWFEILVNNSLAWAQQGWGGHYLSNNMVSVTPFLSASEASASMSQAAQFSRSQNGTATIESMTWYAFYQRYVVPGARAVGRGTVISSRLIPTSLFETSVGRAKIMSFLNYILSYNISPYVPVGPPVLYPRKPNSTSTTPAWYTSLWHVGSSIAIPWNATLEQKDRLIETAMNLTRAGEALAPDSGSYGNEANPWTENWKKAWWGEENYKELLTLKQKWDPEGLFKCYKCIGYVEDENEGGNVGRCFRR